MSSGPTTAMVLATGLGQRMRPLTDRLPKPLVQVRGEAMLDTILDRLQDHCIGKVVVNLHYLGEMIEAHLEYRERPQIVFSRSEEHTSELQSLMRISYAVFCLKKKKKTHIKQITVANHRT